MILSGFFIAIAFLLTPFTIAAPEANAPGTGCNKLPRANPKDCSKIFADYSKNTTLLSCGDTNRVTLTQGDCSAVYKCGDNVKSITADRVAYAAGVMAWVCRQDHSPDHLVSAASAVKYWGRICYMKAGNEDQC